MSTIEMGLPGDSQTNLKYAARLMNQKYVLKGLRAFQRGAVGLCRSEVCKNISCQIWRYEKKSAARPTRHQTIAARDRVPDGS